jgi:hypothetical protein
VFGGLNTGFWLNAFTGKNMEFDVLVDQQFMDMCLDDELSPIDKKNVLSIINYLELDR